MGGKSTSTTRNFQRSKSEPVRLTDNSSNNLRCGWDVVGMFRDLNIRMYVVMQVKALDPEESSI